MRTFNNDLSWNFVVSSPLMTAGEFRNSVIFLVEDNPDFALGVIINRPLDKEISELAELNIGTDLEQVEVY